MSTIIATVKRNLIVKKRAYPLEFFFSNLLHCMFTMINAYFLYSLLFDQNISNTFTQYANTSDYMTYTIVGCYIYMFTVGAVFNVSRSFITEIREGTIESLLVTNVNYTEYLIGGMLEQLLIISVELGIVSIVATIFELDLSNINIISTIVIIFISIIGSFGVIIIICGIMVYLRDTFIVQNTMFAVIGLLCGVTFPIEYLPNFIQYISRMIPITYSLKMTRESILNGATVLSQSSEFICLTLLSIIYCMIGIFLIKNVLRKAIENQFI